MLYQGTSNWTALFFGYIMRFVSCHNTETSKWAEDKMYSYVWKSLIIPSPKSDI